MSTENNMFVRIVVRAQAVGDLGKSAWFGEMSHFVGARVMFRCAAGDAAHNCAIW
jgi:hypothetical protein